MKRCQRSQYEYSNAVNQELPKAFSSSLTVLLTLSVLMRWMKTSTSNFAVGNQTANMHNDTKFLTWKDRIVLLFFSSSWMAQDSFIPQINPSKVRTNVVAMCSIFNLLLIVKYPFSH
jgi:hypothetical protein